jgi:HPt (histidine-containing phosphotransfer) domain-containing protein
MPEMDGVETVKNIRKLGGKYKDLIIIALTANAVAGAKEMFLENSFNDFISKPINAVELREIVQKYLPSDKIITITKKEKPQVSLDKEEELHQKSIITFVKDNRNTFEKLTNSLSSGDIKTAHRIAHTLKSIAGYLGKNELREAALTLEEALRNETANHTNDQLITFEKELKAALDEYEPLFLRAESAKPPAAPIDLEQLKALLTEIKPLLEKGDFTSSTYVEKLESIKGMAELAQHIDDYDFEGALKILNSFF